METSISCKSQEVSERAIHRYCNMTGMRKLNLCTWCLWIWSFLDELQESWLNSKFIVLGATWYKNRLCVYIHIYLFRSLYVNMKYSLYKATCEQVAVFQSFLSTYSSDLMPEKRELTATLQKSSECKLIWNPKAYGSRQITPRHSST